MGLCFGCVLLKLLIEFSDGCMIMGQQYDNICVVFGLSVCIIMVVGYCVEMIIDVFLYVNYVYNECYDEINMLKSLFCVFGVIGCGGVLWMNGDVVFDLMILGCVFEYIECDQFFVIVNILKVSDEEVKYIVMVEGYINEFFKIVKGGFGEVVGINYIFLMYKKVFMCQLQCVEDQDYFECGFEFVIVEDGLFFELMDVFDLYVVEVDFVEDLEWVNFFV